MSAIAKFATFYGVAGIIVGGFFVTTSDDVNFHAFGRPMPLPRLLSWIVFAIVWPVIFWKMITNLKR